MLRKEPGVLRIRDADVVDGKDLYPCYFCGPKANGDQIGIEEPLVDQDIIDESVRTGRIDDDAPKDTFPSISFDEYDDVLFRLSDHLCSEHLLSPAKPYAGTVYCTACKGSPKINKVTPNFARALGLSGPWQNEVMRRAGRLFVGRENFPDDRKRLFFEYRRTPPSPQEAQPRPKFVRSRVGAPPGPSASKNKVRDWNKNKFEFEKGVFVHRKLVPAGPKRSRVSRSTGMGLRSFFEEEDYRGIPYVDDDLIGQQ